MINNVRLPTGIINIKIQIEREKKSYRLVRECTVMMFKNTPGKSDTRDFFCLDWHTPARETGERSEIDKI